MRRSSCRLAAFVCVCAWLSSAPASAQDCVAPPGTAAVDQYCETIPSAGGTRERSGGSRDSQTATSRTVNAVERNGDDGKALSRFLAQSSPAERTTGRDSKEPATTKKPSNERSPAAIGDPSTNPLGAVRSAVSSGATVGQVFILAILAITLLMAGIAWVRYRRRSSPE